MLRVLLTIALLTGQTQQLPKPTFETGVDLIAVDVQVVDKSGRPIVDLRPEDFEVEISGRRRRIASVQFVSYRTPGTQTVPATDPVAPPVPSAPRPRRMFVIAVDEHSLHTSNAAAAVTAAERFIDRLQPDDLVGVYAYPTGAAKHDLTSDHKAARATLGKIAGLFSEPANTFHLSPSEVIDCANNDQEALRRVFERECGRGGCNIRQIHQEAVGLAGFMEMMASQSLGGLRGLLRSLKDVPGRKTLVLVSGGLVTTDRAGGRANTRSEIAQIGREAALANVAVFALHLDWSFIEAVTSRRGIRTAYFRESGMATTGLEAVAGAAGGAVTRVQGTSPDVAFDRVLTETSGHYLLGVEAADADRDGQTHAIRVKVKRGGAQVRSRTFVAIAPSKAKGPPVPVSPAAPPVEQTPAPSAADPTRLTREQLSLEQVLAAAARYLQDYERRIAAVVLEERYVQRVTQELSGIPPEARELRSDVLVISDPEFGWVGFRDTFEVDGRPVRDRDQRLADLFLNHRGDAVAQANRVVAESSRFNLNAGPVIVERSINMPMTALRFLMAGNQARSTFKTLGMKTLDRRPALLVEFSEREKPRIIRTDDGAPARGRLWIDPATGTIMRTELWFDTDNEAEKTSLVVTVRVSFESSDKLGLWLPVSMDEEYRSGRTRITGSATYTNPRRFSVATTEKIKLLN